MIPPPTTRPFRCNFEQFPDQVKRIIRRVFLHAREVGHRSMWYSGDIEDLTLIVVKIWSGILAKFGGSKNEAWLYVKIASPSTIIYIFQQYNRVIRQADAFAWLLHYICQKYDVFRSFTKTYNRAVCESFQTISSLTVLRTKYKP
jgi:hypothetical protein